MSKAKILLVGSVGENLDVLQKKLESLQSSKAGPFDACFCVGSWSVQRSDEAISTITFPLPVYLHEFSGPQQQQNSQQGNGAAIVSLGGNLFYLQGDKTTRDKAVQFIEIKFPNSDHELVVGCCSKHIRLDSSSSQQLHPKQCDFLLSSDWPQGMEDVLNVETEPLSFDVAQVALHCRPRYHVAPSSLCYHQSPPYALLQSEHVGRFIALPPVIPGKTTSKSKFIHALGLVPLSANPPPTTAPSTLPCPFVTTTTTTTTTTNSVAFAKSASFSQKNVPGFVAAAKARDNDGAGHYSMFAMTTNGRKRSGREGGENNQPLSLEQPPEDPTVKTLFLYGLHKDVTGELQNSNDNPDNNNKNNNSKIFQAFARYGLVHVRYPPNASTSTFCFLEFPDQKAAHACLLDCRGRTTVGGVDLTLKWATTPANNNKRSRHESNTGAERHYVTQEEAPDSTTLYFHPPKDKENDEDFCNSLCQYLQQTLEEALNEGNDGETAERVTAETEPALKVSVRRKDHYGFLEFASHAAATMALAAVTQSTDGGFIQEAKTEDSIPSQQPSHLIGVTLRWAKGEPPKTKRQELLEALGLERYFFAADTRTDCWFCLASPTCETHLITAVYKDWYATMPKGPVHPGHILLVPVTHTRQGAWTLQSPEWIELLDRLAEHASEAYDCDLFIFERAMETRGGYHSHVNCVPIPRNDDNTAMQQQELQSTMLAHAKASGFELRPIQSDLGIEALMKSRGEEGESQYFYAEIRTRRQSYRFFYQHNNNNDEDGSRVSTVPLQFAREVLAAVLKNPKLAHWKSCVVDKEQEAELAADFRESFTKTMSKNK